VTTGDTTTTFRPSTSRASSTPLPAAATTATARSTSMKRRDSSNSTASVSGAGRRRTASESSATSPTLKGRRRGSTLHLDPLHEEGDASGDNDDSSTDWREGGQDGDNNDEEHTFSGPLHYLPLIVAVVPPLGAVLHGRAEAWTDALILLLVAFYLYQVVRVPWELYYASRTRRINQAASVLTDNDSDTPESVKKRRKAASAELQRNELFSLALCVVSPFLGSFLLYYVRSALSEPDRYINPFNIRLFVLASGVKPWSHFLKLVKARSLFLQSEVHYPVTTVALLMRRVKELEEEVDDLRRAYATKDDVRQLRDGVDLPLTQLSKAVRRYERKEEYLRLSSEEKFNLLSERQEEMLHEIALSAQVIEQIRTEQEKSGSVIRALRHIFSGSRAGSGEGHEVYVWYERGPFFYMFLPLIASNRIMDATGRLFDGLAKKVGSIERSGMIEDSTGAVQ